MDIGKLNAAASSIQPQVINTVNDGIKPPRDGFQKSADSDPGLMKMEQLAKFKTKDVGEALFGKSKKAVEKLEDQVIREHSLWSYEKAGHTRCDTVRDAKRDTVYTGVGYIDKWYLTALNSDGTVKWAFTEERGQSDPVLDKEGNIYFRTDKNLYSLDPDGNVNWKFPDGGSWNDSPPVIGPDGTVYIVAAQDHISFKDENQALVAIKDGKELWRYKSHGDYTGDPQPLVGKDGTIYFGADKDVKKGIIFKKTEEKPFLIALNPDGSEKFKADVKYWPSYVSTQLTEGPDGTIYACHGDKELTAFNPDTGKEKWHFHLDNRVKMDRAIARLNQVPGFDEEGNLYLASDITSNYPEGYLIKMNSNGEKIWEKSMGTGFSTRPHIGPDGRIWVGTGRGDLASYSKDGDFKGTYRVGHMFSNNFAFGDEGEIFLNTEKRIIAFQPDMSKIHKGEMEEAKEKLINKEEKTEAEPEEPGIKVEKDFVEIGGVKIRKGGNFKKI